MALIKDLTGANAANVNTDSELQVQLTKTVGKAGFANLNTEIHDGVVGTTKLQRVVKSTIENRLEVGTDTILWDDVFTGANINLTKYFSIQTTMTTAQTGGAITLNSGASIATTTAAMLRTYRTFPISNNFPTTLDFVFSLSLTPQSQNIIEIGLGLPAAANPYAPTDGIYMLIDAAGALQLVANFNGSTTTSGAITFTWAANRFYHMEIVCHNNRAELWIDQSLYGSVARPTASGTLSMVQSPYLYSRLVNVAGTSGAQKVNISRWAVTLNDANSNRLWSTAMGAMGQNSVNIPDGVTAGQTANYVNSTAPTSATLSNTAAGYTNLGGQWQFAAVAGAETDFALFAYQVPLPSTNQTGKNLIIRGVRIESFNMGAAVATTLTLLQWGFAVGSTSVSLATTDSGISGTRAPRRIMLGTQSFPVGAAIGQNASAIDVNFDAAMICEPGTFVHIILKMPVGTATASQIIRGTVTVNGYFE